MSILLLALAGWQGAAAETAADRPNIIFILSDDLSWGDLGCYGGDMIQTPGLDRFAREGMRFTNAYSGNSVCAPARSCLMEGKHPGHARVRGNSYRGYRHALQKEDTTVAEVLKEAGYATGLFGKWGLALSSQPEGLPNARGFDEFFGYLNQRKAHSFYPEFLWHNTEKIEFPGNIGHDHRQQSTYDADGKVIPAGIPNPEEAVYSFDLIHEKSLEFIDAHKDDPFFLYLAPTLPHGPAIAPELGSYKDKDWTIGQKEWAAMVTRLDAAVGDVLGRLEKHELTEQTLIFFASDNGHSTHGYDRDKTVTSIGDHFQSYGPTRGHKGDYHDGAFRVPALARWPGKIPAGVDSDHIWAFWDFLPTAAEVAEVTPPEDIDGISFLPALIGDGEQEQHDYLYWEFGNHQSVRAGDWFATRPNGGEIRLYDLSADPQQKTDLASSHPELTDRILSWMNTSHTPSEVWPSPGESPEDYEARLKTLGITGYESNIDG